MPPCVAPLVRTVAPPPRPRNRTTLGLEALEPRENPADVLWASTTTGGDWSVGSNWVGGMVPTEFDRAVISLPSTETVTVPATLTTTVESFTSSAALTVTGTLTATGKSIVSGELDVTGTLRVGLWSTVPPLPGIPPTPPPPTSFPPETMDGPYPHSLLAMTEPSGLIALGGGDISGTVETVTVVYLVGGDFSLVSAGKLAGEGWYGLDTKLSLDGDDAAVNNLGVITGGIVEGDADLTVNTTFVSAGGVLKGPANSLVTVGGAGFIVAPVGGAQQDGAVLDARELKVPEGKTLEISADIPLKNGAVIENKGTVEVTAVQQIYPGAGGGRVDNFGDWKVLSGGETVKVPFLNTKSVTADAGTLQDQQLVFFDYTQNGQDAAISFSGSTVWVAKADIVSGSLLGGDASRIGFFNVDSTLDGTGTSKLSFSGGPVLISFTDLTADQNSTVRFDAEGGDGWAVNIANSIVALNGLSIWTQGNIGTAGPAGTYGTIENSGTFRVLSHGKKLGVLLFDNGGRFEQAADGGDTTWVTGTFWNRGQGSNGVHVTSGAVRFGGDTNEFSGTTVTGEGTAIIFYRPAPIPGVGGLFTTFDARTTVTGSASFSGTGMVSVVGGAVWKLPAQSVLVPVDNLTLTTDTLPRAPGELNAGILLGIPDPQHPEVLGGSISIRQTVKFDSFRLDKIGLVIEGDATGKMTPAGNAAIALVLDAAITVKRTLEWTGANDVTANNSTIFVGVDSGNAQFIINTNANIYTLAAEAKGSSIVLNPNGSLVRGNAGGTNKLDVSIFNDGGTANVSGLTVKYRLEQSAGTTTLAGGQASFGDGVKISGGTLDLAGGALTAGGDPNQGDGLSGVEIRSGGTLTGAGTITGKVQNWGTIEVGGKGMAGTLNLNDDFYNYSTGTVVVDLGPPQAGTGYDQICVCGKAHLGGTLSIKKLDGFNVNGNDRYTIMTFGSRSGTFATVTGANIRNPALEADPQDTKFDLK